jgi:hypothetical protein
MAIIAVCVVLFIMGPLEQNKDLAAAPDLNEAKPYRILYFGYPIPLYILLPLLPAEVCREQIFGTAQIHLYSARCSNFTT